MKNLLALGLPLLGLVYACGNDADFGGPTQRSEADANKGADDGADDGTDVQEPDGDGGDPSLPHFAALNWYWECASTPGGQPTPGSDDEVVVTGQGPHKFAREQLSGTPVTFSGRVCPPAQVARDIVFVIDTSGSMSGNDPMVGGTCGRLSAVQQVITSASAAGTTRFGIVTFSTGVDATSTALFATDVELFTDVTRGVPSDVASVLCATNDSTNYNAGLSQAATLLRLGRDTATKEIYFVSDGQPDPADQDGVAIAGALKGIGVNVGAKFIPVTIATVMLAGVDKVMAQSIASKGANGLPLHANVAQTGELTKVLTDLAKNDIVSALFQYRPIGAPDWSEVDILAHMQDFDFTLPPVTIDVDDPAAGIEVQYEYKDAHGQVTTSGGKLEWTSDDGT